MELEDYLTINESDLEGECKLQAIRVEDVARRVADTTQEIELCNQEIEVKVAELYEDIKSTALSTGLKITEAALLHKINKDGPLQELRSTKISLAHDKAILLGLQKALDHKRDMLKSLTYTASREGVF